VNEMVEQVFSEVEQERRLPDDPFCKR